MTGRKLFAFFTVCSLVQLPCKVADFKPDFAPDNLRANNCICHRSNPQRGALDFATLDRLFSQTVQAEIIVTDFVSTDRTVSIVHSFGERIRLFQIPLESLDRSGMSTDKHELTALNAHYREDRSAKRKLLREQKNLRGEARLLSMLAILLIRQRFNGSYEASLAQQNIKKTDCSW